MDQKGKRVKPIMEIIKKDKSLGRRMKKRELIEATIDMMDKRLILLSLSDMPPSIKEPKAPKKAKRIKINPISLTLKPKLSKYMGYQVTIIKKEKLEKNIPK